MDDKAFLETAKEGDFIRFTKFYDAISGYVEGDMTGYVLNANEYRRLRVEMFDGPVTGEHSADRSDYGEIIDDPDGSLWAKYVAYQLTGGRNAGD